MSMNEIEAKCRELRQLQNLIAEAEQEAEAIKDSIKAHPEWRDGRRCLGHSGGLFPHKGGGAA